MTFRFDVAMEPSTVTYSMSFTPTSGITLTPSVTWSDSNRVLTLNGIWPSAKQYTIAIAGSSTSQDGQALDGNRDGVGGDPFTLHFSTALPTTCTCQVDNPSCPLDIFCSSDLGCPLDTGCPADGCLCEVQCACQLDL